MSVFIVDLDPTLPDYSQRTTLDGREYHFRFQWNVREAKWYMSLKDSADSAIVDNVKVVANFPFLKLLTDARRPPGEIIAQCTSGIDPGLKDLGGRVTLTYVDAAELGR